MIRTILLSAFFLLSFLHLNAQCTATINGSVNICEGTSGELTVDLTGTPPWSIEYEIDGGTPVILSNISSTPYSLTVSEGGTYTLLSVSTPTCSNGTVSGSGEVTILGAPEAFNLIFECDPTNTSYTVSFSIQGGDPTSYSVTPMNGTMSGNVFTSNPIPVGDGYSFILDDANSCDPQLIEGTIICNCESTAGELDTTPIEACGDGPITGQYDATNEFLDANDVLQFILFSDSNIPLGAVIGRYTTPEVTFDPAIMNYGSTYYLAALAGNDDGSGNVDINDPCLDFSQGTPITFFSPIEVTLSGNTEIPCTGESITLNCTPSGGTPPYTFLWTGPDGFTSTEQNPTISNAGPYTLIVEDANGCTINPINIVIDEPAELLCSVNGSFEIPCGEEEIQLTLSCTGGTPPYSYVWSNGLNFPFITVSAAGTYTVTITDANGCFAISTFNITQSPEGCGTIQGNVVNDLNADCLNDAGDTPLKNWLIRATGDGEYFGITDTSGNYQIYALPGDYTVEVIEPVPGLWMPCSASENVTLPSANDVVTVDFQMQALKDCPLMQVDISSPFYRRCFDNWHFVDYCNMGTATAENISIEVTLDPDFSVTFTSLPFTSPSAGFYIFEIPNNVQPNECGQIQIKSTLSCDAMLGETLCSEAHIYPDSLCEELNPLWSGASLSLSSECTTTEVIFTITNEGTGDMAAPVNFIVIEDGVMANSLPQQVQLTANDKMEVAYPANGSTYVMLLEQVPYHPGMSMPTLAVEGCGTNPAGGFSTGFVTQFPEDDKDLFISIDCQVVIGAYDPNDKYGYPAGYGDEHFIDLGQPLEYRIRFQNTGTDTAFNVVIEDVISPHLDLSTLQLGATSHPFEVSIKGRDTLIFTFNNIMLPDSNVNEPASHGFVKFRIQQAAQNLLGDVIENEAAIFFDFNDPVITNKTVHTLGEHYIISSSFEPRHLDIQHAIQPNPASGEATLSLIGQVPSGKMEIRFFDLAGRTAHLQTMDAPSGQLNLTALKPGIYFYEIMMKGQQMGMGKMVVK